MNFVKLCQIIEALRIQQKVKDKERDPLTLIFHNQNKPLVQEFYQK